jgi:hypothetical protein
MEFTTIAYIVLWKVSFPDGDDGNKSIDFYFNNQPEAQIYANIKQGPFKLEGRVNETHHEDRNNLPKCYSTAKDCALHNMKAVDFLSVFGGRL